MSKDRYYLKDLAGDKVIGSFYEEYLVLYKPPAEGAEYKVDPNHNDFKRNKTITDGGSTAPQNFCYQS